MANAEMEVGGEDESGLDEALLPGLGGDEDEDAVASQLVSAGERSSNRGGKRYSPCGILYSKKFWAMIFVLFTMLGLSASVFAVYSCDIVAVEWNANLKLVCILWHIFAMYSSHLQQLTTTKMASIDVRRV